MMSQQEFVATITESHAARLLASLKKMPTEKLHFRASETTRTPMEMITECAKNPLLFLAMITGGDVQLSEEQQKQPWLGHGCFDSLGEAEIVMNSNVAKLVSAIRSIPDERLKETVMTPFFGGTEIPLQMLIIFPYRNMVYHTGQINYIQTIYGDLEM